MGFKYIPIDSTTFPFGLGKIFFDHGYKICIETGTYFGYTAIELAKIFDKVYTIEASEVLFNKAHKSISQHKNILHINGDSRVALQSILRNLNDKKIVFWLDAHYCSGQTYNNHSPLLEEIEIINNSSVQQPIVIVDDARYILSKFDGERYTDLTKFIIALHAGTRAISCIEDAFIAVPDSLENIVDEYANKISKLHADILSGIRTAGNMNSLKLLLK